jgi:hypothetical protein
VDLCRFGSYSDVDNGVTNSLFALQFSLPMPQGGRSAVINNPILREDQLPSKVLHPKSKKSSKLVSAPAIGLHDRLNKDT